MNSTQTKLPAFTLQPGAATGGAALSVVGDSIRILADSASTGGACVIFEAVTPPAGGPPLHRHGRDDEHFCILEGKVKFSIDGKEIVLGPGGYAYAPRGSVHTFVNAGPTPSRMIITCTPGGLEAPFRACDCMVREGRQTMEAVVAAFREFDLEIMGPPLKP
jgi:mannose-6-phosphate isomerase-like protein (cupin superfamily)